MTETVKFYAKMSGDHECFTFAVDKEVFREIAKKVPTKYDRNRFIPKKYDLYPDQVIRAAAGVCWGRNEERDTFYIEIKARRIKPNEVIDD